MEEDKEKSNDFTNYYRGVVSGEKRWRRLSSSVYN